MHWWVILPFTGWNVVAPLVSASCPQIAPPSTTTAKTFLRGCFLPTSPPLGAQTTLAPSIPLPLLAQSKEDSPDLRLFLPSGNTLGRKNQTLLLFQNLLRTCDNTLEMVHRQATSMILYQRTGGAFKNQSVIPICSLRRRLRKEFPVRRRMFCPKFQRLSWLRMQKQKVWEEMKAWTPLHQPLLFRCHFPHLCFMRKERHRPVSWSVLPHRWRVFLPPRLLDSDTRKPGWPRGNGHTKVMKILILMLWGENRWKQKAGSLIQDVCQDVCQCSSTELWQLDNHQPSQSSMQTIFPVTASFSLSSPHNGPSFPTWDRMF